MRRRAFIKVASGLLVPAAFPAIVRGQVFGTYTDQPFLAKSGAAVDPGCANATALNWSGRVVTNGGAAPSNATLCAVGDFCAALTAASIDTKMRSVCMFVPDNMTAALTPIYTTVGSDPWVKSGGIVAGNLTTAGLKGGTPGSNDHLTTGIVCNTAFASAANVGVTLYTTNYGSGGAYGGFGATDGAPKVCVLFDNYAGSAYWQCPQGSATWAQSANPIYGYFSGSRISSVLSTLYFANSTNPHSAVAVDITSTGSLPAYGMYIFAVNAAGVTSASGDQTHSFAGVHDALTVTESLALYNAIQTCRVSLGGGYA